LYFITAAGRLAIKTLEQPERGVEFSEKKVVENKLGIVKNKWKFFATYNGVTFTYDMQPYLR